MPSERTFGIPNPDRVRDPFLTREFVDDFDRAGFAAGAPVAAGVAFDGDTKWDIVSGATGIAVPGTVQAIPGRSNGWWRMTAFASAADRSFVRIVTKVPVVKTSALPFTHFRIVGAFAPGFGPEGNAEGPAFPASFIVAGLSDVPAPPYGRGIVWLAPAVFPQTPGVGQYDIILAPNGSPADLISGVPSEDCDNPDHIGGIISNRAVPPGSGEDGPGSGLIALTTGADPLSNPANPRGEFIGKPTDFDPSPVTDTAYYLTIMLVCGADNLAPFLDPGVYPGQYPAYGAVSAPTHDIIFDLDYVEARSERGCQEIPPS